MQVCCSSAGRDTVLAKEALGLKSPSVIAKLGVQGQG